MKKLCESKESALKLSFPVSVTKTNNTMYKDAINKIQFNKDQKKCSPFFQEIYHKYLLKERQKLQRISVKSNISLFLLISGLKFFAEVLLLYTKLDKIL